MAPVHTTDINFRLEPTLDRYLRQEMRITKESKSTIIRKAIYDGLIKDAVITEGEHAELMAME